MQIIIHRGSNEVGGNCIELRSVDTRIILDVGLPLFDRNRNALDGCLLSRMSKEELVASGIAPNVQGLFGGGDAPHAILLSHAHLDHVGLLDHTATEIPVFASKGTSKMMLAGELFASQTCIRKDRYRELISGVPITIGAFTITPFAVDHSIHGCLAFLVETQGVRLLYTGDLRLHGARPGDHEFLIKATTHRAIDALLIEGTHFGFDNGSETTESELADEILRATLANQSLVLAAFSTQHIDRLSSFIQAAQRSGRTFIADPYTAFVLHLIDRDAGISNPLKQGSGRVYYPQSLRVKIDRAGTNKVFELYRKLEIELSEIKANPASYLMVFRSSLLTDFEGELPAGTSCLYSTWHGYSQRSDWKAVRAALDRVKGKLVYLHTSGHALSTDLIAFAQAVNPRVIIPVHTFHPEAFQSHFDNVLIATDGVPICLTDSEGTKGT